jgi:hypothetical protein
MGKRFNVSTPKPYSDGSGKTWWLKVGSAWQNDKGLITVYLDAYPTPDKDGVIKMMLFEPEPNQTQGQRKEPEPVHAGGWNKAIDDEIPF